MDYNSTILFDEYHLEYSGPMIGLRLYNSNEYLGTYLSFDDCLYDLAFRWEAEDFEKMKTFFISHGKEIKEPYNYRGVVSEIFWPIDQINRYIFYGDSMQEVIAIMESHEQRSIKLPHLFAYGVQGSGIHLFDKETNQYEPWLGGHSFNSVSDIIQQAHDTGKFIPSKLISEFDEIKNYDVFISHKSEDYDKARKIYETMVTSGFKSFLSEVTLPNISNSDYSYEIDKALDNSDNIIVLATSKEAIESGWVSYEWSAFANEVRSGRKNGNIITVVNSAIDVSELPLTLRQYEVIDINQINLIKDFIRK